MVDGSPSSVGSVVMHISLWNNLMLFTCTSFSEGCLSSRVDSKPSSAAGAILRVLRAVLVFLTHATNETCADGLQANPTELIRSREFSTNFPEEIWFISVTHSCVKMDKFSCYAYKSAYKPSYCQTWAFPGSFVPCLKHTKLSRRFMANPTLLLTVY